MAEYDLETAKAMLDSRRYIYTVFMCHLCLEKLLKAFVIEYAGMDVPPYTHNLRVLAELSKLELPEVHARFIAELSPQAIASRYPESTRSYNRLDAERYLDKTREVFQWLRQKLK